MTDDIILLRRYFEGQSEEAFTELVRRHVGLVYHAALRQTSDQMLAQDITQSVFADLARKGGSLVDRTTITGWLYTSTHFAAAKAKRTERRRQAREQEAYKMNELTYESATVADWEKLRPVIDETLLALNEDDREAVLLRFFEGRPLAEVGARLAVSEDTARVRVARALDKLHALLMKRGVSSTSVALSVALSAQAGVAVPAGLVGSVASGALAGAATLGGATFLGWLSTSKLAGAGIGAGACIAIGAALFEARALSDARTRLEAAGRERAGILAQLRDLEGKLDAERRRSLAAETDLRKLRRADQGLTVVTTTSIDPEIAAPMTQDSVDARYRKALELARTGQTAAALEEFLWCYDEGMKSFPTFRGVRLSFLLSEMGKLGAPGLAALRERRDKAQKSVFANERNVEAASEFAAINRVLEEDDLTIAIYDQLPASDPRRRTLAGGAYRQLVSARRHADAVQGRSYAVMLSSFEASIRRSSLPANLPDPEAFLQRQRSAVVKMTAESIEVLAGGGEVENARRLAARLLAFDASAETKAAIQHHATRAGQPGLLAGVGL